MRRCHHMPVRAAHFASGRSDAIDLRGIGCAMVARREHDICGTPLHMRYNCNCGARVAHIEHLAARFIVNEDGSGGAAILCSAGRIVSIAFADVSPSAASGASSCRSNAARTAEGRP